ncbi:hemolysin family protein [Shewanella schlegeliana]|uniref:Polyamine export protein n=1 Tax=Shewanella schlegeliana TaxID=190308 RepID=A0ABS1SW97_9GAMM|nr:hemolysin family protein [Shewanella schlegeliana]MBL4912305.1 HlyC/CorC family transporter [Shewanella schlegeliana]MCL1108226.1 hemolysin family protein [Shewanella schlegeliana]GIU22264.1 membrane protein [Shewanella schlegeliana]
MSFFDNAVIILLLIGVSCFFSMSEIALAAGRKIRLRQLASEGDARADKVLLLQSQPGNFFTVVQIGLNAVAIMGGIVGESAFTPYFHSFLSSWLSGPWLDKMSFLLSFVFVTSLFILIADLMPKRLAMAFPEKVAMTFVGPMMVCIVVLKPLVWFFNGLANFVFRVFQVQTARNDAVTSDDIYAVMDAGAEAGVLDKGDQLMMEKVFEMQTIPVTAAMTARESLAYFLLQDSEEEIKAKIAQQPHSNFLVCDEQLDTVVGIVNAKKLLICLINGEKISLTDKKLVTNCFIIPDTLSLSESMDYFKNSRADFAIVMNEYSLVVGVVTAKDLQDAVMGAWSLPESEEQIIARDERSWLMDGVTPIIDVMRALDIEEFPQNHNYETIAGFMMFMLRKIPKCTDSVTHAGFKFEVVDVDSYKVDQLLVTRIEEPTMAEELELKA